MRNGAAEVFQNLGVLDSLIVMEAATDNPGATKIDMLRRIAEAGGVRLPIRWSNGPGRSSGRGFAICWRRLDSSMWERLR